MDTFTKWAGGFAIFFVLTVLASFIAYVRFLVEYKPTRPVDGSEQDKQLAEQHRRRLDALHQNQADASQFDDDDDDSGD